jgi:hypothetical protein
MAPEDNSLFRFPNGRSISPSFSDSSVAGVRAYQTNRLKERAAPKTINEEVGFLLRLLGDKGDSIRLKMRREKALKLKVRRKFGKAYSKEEKLSCSSSSR